MKRISLSLNPARWDLIALGITTLITWAINTDTAATQASARQ